MGPVLRMFNHCFKRQCYKIKNNLQMRTILNARMERVGGSAIPVTMAIASLTGVKGVSETPKSNPLTHVQR